MFSSLQRIFPYCAAKDFQQRIFSYFWAKGENPVSSLQRIFPYFVAKGENPVSSQKRSFPFIF